MDIETRVNGYVEGLQDKIDKHYKTDLPNLTIPKLEVTKGKRYYKVTRNDSSSRSVVAFIDAENGDILKPASWKAPAKHARGNVYDEDFGLSQSTAYGPNYLK